MSNPRHYMTNGLPRLSLLGLMLMSLTGCAYLRTPSTVIVSDFCSIAEPITYSASGDTVETQRQIRSHNAAYLKTCPEPNP